MGKLASVVYDVTQHAPLVLRTRVSTPAERYGVIDAVSAFAHHCEALRGVARSPVHVSALWGGPPYVTYQVVRSRFRVIIMWVDASGDFDVAHDVQDALLRLHTAVAAVADRLSGEHDSAAVAHAYDVAGKVLLDDRSHAEYLAHETPPPGITQAGRKPLARVADKAPSLTSSQSQKSGKSGGLFGGLFGGTKQKRIDSLSKYSSKSSAAGDRGQASNVLSISTEGKEATGEYAIPFDSETTPSQISLPEEVFAWSDFGAPLPPSAGDLEWIGLLIQGIEKPKAAPLPPVSRTPSLKSIADSNSIAGGEQSLSSQSQDGRIVLPSPPSDRMSESASGSGVEASAPGKLETAKLRQTPGAAASSLSSGIPNAVAAASSVGPTSNVASNAVAASAIVGASHLAPPRALPVERTIEASGVDSRSEPLATAQRPPKAVSGVNTTAFRSVAASSQPAVLAGATQLGTVDAPVPAQLAGDGDAGISSQGTVPSPVPLSGPLPPTLGGDDSDFDVAALGALRTSGGATGSDGDSSGNAIASNPNVRPRMNEFANTMQAGNYPLALKQVVGTLQILSNIRPVLERETIACATYFQALQILIRVRALEAEINVAVPNSTDAMRKSVEVALLTMFLAEQKDLLPRHSVAVKKMAVEKNIVVGNFGMAARWLRSLIDAVPPMQKPAFMQRLQICIQNKELNTHMPPSKWLCYNTLSIIARTPIKCTLCPAVFAPGSAKVTPMQLCPVCRSAQVALLVK